MFLVDLLAPTQYVPDTTQRVKIATGEPMRDYQHRAAHQLFTGVPYRDMSTGRALWELLVRVGTAIFIDMGLGKTIIALTAIVDWFAFRTITKPVLIIAPIKVCETVWRQEAAAWTHTRHLMFSLVRGDEKKRAFALKRPAHIYLINPEMVAWLAKFLRNDWSCFDAVIIDEVSAFKDHRSKRFRTLTNYGTRVTVKDAWGVTLKDAAGDAVIVPPHSFKRVGVLTGTPSPSSLRNLWAPLYICDHGERLHKKYDTFEGRFFHKARQLAPHVHEVKLNSEEDEVRPAWIARDSAPERIHELIADITVELNAADYGVLPEVIDHVHKVQLPDALRAQYDMLEKEAILELTKDVLMAQNGGAKSMMCWQFANGAIHGADDFGRRMWHELHEAKLDKAIELIDMLNTNIIIPYWFTHDLARLKARLTKEGMAYTVLASKNVEAIVDRWNAGLIPILLLHPMSAGHGLNLQFGGHTFLWFSMLWSLEKYLQTRARLARSGQLYPVGNHHILTEKTTDELMWLNLGEKGDEQTRFRTALRTYQTLRQLGLFAPNPFEGLGI